ncbi:MAG: deoxyguanosinetriphosphate triphosphohydrolase [Chitinophagales bacterium]|nr:deoxyguanosinetriphosphate triphosphohydrolase [Chitinophagaceae bacterium]MCB9063990.1 deoxyguanosinetriphosphate triphosphohydrolase [Chitinophagales bacterium]
MNWNTLYSVRRTGDPEHKVVNPDQVRTSFQRDYDRLIFSSAFRRLQNKTQVFPLPRAVFVHNRLTHSLEVASVGRSLGKFVGDAIAEKYPNESQNFIDFYRYELSSVIAAACLAHDIGNPPFGHSGEYAIRTFFKELDDATKQAIGERLTEKQIQDFELFEGNSNALRILTNNFNENEEGGYKLTYTTLASIVKYPCASHEGFDKSTGLIATKKSGYFNSEADTYKHIADTLGIPKRAGHETVYARHPFVFLTEAADDICYRIIDMEDAHRLDIISLEQIQELFYPFFDEAEGYNSMAYVNKKVDGLRDANQKVQYIRARWIGLMTDKLARIFMQHEEALLAGELQQDLMSCLPEKDKQLIDVINDFSFKHIYNYKSVVQIEIAGYNVIGGLLKELMDAILHPDKTKSFKLLQLVPAQFAISRDRDKLYENVLSIVDFISGMTDLYAIDLYRKITGINIPEIR